MKQKNNKGALIYLLVTALVISGLVYVFQRMSRAENSMDLSQVMQYFDDLKVSEFTLDLGTGSLQMKVEGEEQEISYEIPNVSVFMSELFNDNYNYREAYNEAHPDAPLKYNLKKIQDNSFWLNLLMTVGFFGVTVFIIVFMMKNAAGTGKLNSFGKANTRSLQSNAKKVTFEDVAGADEEKEELREIVGFLKDSKKYSELGARVPKGVLLLGPPGTGKTLLARAVAGEANAPFFSISGSDFVEMFVGVGASRVRDLFEQAKKAAPAIIFIDEIDAVGRQRGAGLGGGNDEREQTLNQLLVEIDGFVGNENVIVMAATNRRDVLDPALLRPGRFDRQIYVNYPDVKGREEILKVHTKNKPLAPDVDLKTIAKETVGFTGADLENLTNEGALLAARKGKKSITKEDLEEAAVKVIVGPEKKSKVINEDEKRLTAYHEAGHAICTYYCQSQDKVHQVSIIPRGQAGGYTMHLPEKDKSYVSKREMRDSIVVLLGGRVAEKLILDDISTGASNDLERATSTARSMVTRYGFSEKLGPIVYGNDEREVFLGRDYTANKNYSEHVATEIDSEMRAIIEDAFQSAEDILSEHLDQLHTVAKYLMEHEKIDGATFYKLMRGEIKNDTPETQPEITNIDAESHEEVQEEPKQEN